MNDALKEIWKARYKKAKDREFDIRDIEPEKEVELIKVKIDMYLDAGNMEKVEELSKQLKSIESFIALKSN